MRVPFVDASPGQVRSAITLAKNAAKPKPPPDEGIRTLQAAVGARGRVSRHADGQVRVRVTDASVAELRALLAILEAHPSV